MLVNSIMPSQTHIHHHHYPGRTHAGYLGYSQPSTTSTCGATDKTIKLDITGGAPPPASPTPLTTSYSMKSLAGCKGHARPSNKFEPLWVSGKVLCPGPIQAVPVVGAQLYVYGRLVQSTSGGRTVWETWTCSWMLGIQFPPGSTTLPGDYFRFFAKQNYSRADGAVVGSECLPGFGDKNTSWYMHTPTELVEQLKLTHGIYIKTGPS